MHLVSQNLALAVGKDGKPANGWTQDEVTRLYEDAFDQFAESSIGRELINRAGPDIIDEIVKACHARFEHTSPSQTPFYENLEEIGKDLLATLPPQALAPALAAQPKRTVKTAAQLAAEEEAAETNAARLGKVKQFAFMYNDALINHGVASVKPNQGIVTIRVGIGESMKAYRYPVAEATQLLEEAYQHNLIS